MTAPATGDLKIPVCTVFPCQGTSFGSPTFTEIKVAAPVMAPDR